MSKLSDFYADYASATGDKSGTKEESTFERLKRIMYEYGYKMSNGEEPKDLINADLMDKVGSEGFRSDALINTLIEMDNEYRTEKEGASYPSPTLPLSLGLKEKEYVPRSESDMLREAEEELLPSLVKNKNKAESAVEATRSELKERGESYLESAEEEQLELLKKGASALENHRDNMIFQGIYDSTINSEGAKNIERSVQLESKKIVEEYDQKMLKIKRDLTLAEKEYENAIIEYDLEYAADLQAKLNKLKLSEEKRRDEIENYNQKLAEKEATYQAERTEMLRKMREEREDALFEEMKREQADEAQNGISEEKRLEYERRKNLATTFYSNFTKEEAFVLIADASDKLKSLLGEEEFFRLLHWNNQR